MKRAIGPSFLDFKNSLSTEEFPDSFAAHVRSLGDTYFFEPAEVQIVTRAADARFVLTNPNFSADRGSFFISRMPDLDLNLIPDFFGVVRKMMVMSDDEDHTKRREIATGAFAEHILDRLSETIQTTVKRLVASVKGRQEFEFVETMSRQLPTTVLADMFSIPEADRLDFAKKANIMTGFFGGASRYQNEDGIEVNEAAKSLRSYFEDLVKERRGGDGNDFVSLVLRAQPNSGLNDAELISQLVMMLVAGQVTTTDQINNSMFLLARHPEIQRDLKSDLSLVPKALNELMRYDPAVTFLFRVARAPGLIGEQPVEAGQAVFISTHCVNRDPGEFTEPHTIDIRRKAKHMSFGFGAHHCLGAMLARREMNTLFSEILTQLPLLSLDENNAAVRDHYSVSFSGFKTLPLRT